MAHQRSECIGTAMELLLQPPAELGEMNYLMRVSLQEGDILTSLVSEAGEGVGKANRIWRKVSIAILRFGMQGREAIARLLRKSREATSNLCGKQWKV